MTAKITRMTIMSLTTIPINKARDLLSKERYGKTYAELDNTRQLIIEELLRT